MSDTLTRKRRDFTIVPNAMFSDTNMAWNSKLIFAYLHKRAGNDGSGTSFPSKNDIARNCGISYKSVERGLEQLELLNYLTKKPRYKENSREQTSNLYTIYDEPYAEVIGVVVWDKKKYRYTLVVEDKQPTPRHCDAPPPVTVTHPPRHSDVPPPVTVTDRTIPIYNYTHLTTTPLPPACGGGDVVVESEVVFSHEGDSLNYLQGVSDKGVDNETFVGERNRVAHDLTPYEDIMNTFNAITEKTALEPVITLPQRSKRRRAVKAVFDEFGLDKINEVFSCVAATPFLRGEAESDWKPDFNWIFKTDNFVKILEGKYSGAGNVPNPSKIAAAQALPPKKNRFCNFESREYDPKRYDIFENYERATKMLSGEYGDLPSDSIEWANKKVKEHEEYTALLTPQGGG